MLFAKWMSDTKLYGGHVMRYSQGEFRSSVQRTVRENPFFGLRADEEFLRVFPAWRRYLALSFADLFCRSRRAKAELVPARVACFRPKAESAGQEEAPGPHKLNYVGYRGKVNERPHAEI
jgi:hypothetical protein